MILAFAAGLLTAALGTVAATRARSLTGVALFDLAVCELIVLMACAAGWLFLAPWCVALLVLLFVLCPDGQIPYLAPVYGAGVLLVGELVTQSAELRGVAGHASGVTGQRLARALIACALAACAALAARAASGVAANRSVLLTAVGVIAALVCVGLITRLATSSTDERGASAVEGSHGGCGQRADPEQDLQHSTERAGHHEP